MSTPHAPSPLDDAARRLGWAWLGLCLALAVHVTDEAATDFLSVYNPIVIALRERLPLLPLPTFTFGPWLAGLVVLIAALLLLSPFAFRGERWMVPSAYVFATVMIANALGHLTWSVVERRFIPGVFSSPLLLAACAYLLTRVRDLQHAGS